jgi:hypothetical protein
MSLDGERSHGGNFTPPPTDHKTPYRTRGNPGETLGDTSLTGLLQALNEINDRTKRTDTALTRLHERQTETERRIQEEQTTRNTRQTEEINNRDAEIRQQQQQQLNFQLPPFRRPEAFHEQDHNAPPLPGQELRQHPAAPSSSTDTLPLPGTTNPLEFDEVRLANFLLEWSCDSRNSKKVKTRDREEIDFLHRLLKYRNQFSEEDRKVYKKRLRLFYVVADINWNAAVIDRKEVDRTDFGIVLSDRTTASRPWKRGTRTPATRSFRGKSAKRGK